MKRNLTGWACALAAVLVLLNVGYAPAAVVSGNVTGGSSGGSFSELDPPPAIVGPDAFQSPDLVAFNELQQVTLLEPLPISPTRVIPAGTVVSSHYVAFDPAEPSTIEGTVLFDEPILAIIGAPPVLDDTADLFGVVGVEYSVSPAIGPEMNGSPEMFNRAPNDRRRLQVSAGANSPGDHVRVLTGFMIPEPTTLLLLLASGVTAFGVRR